MEDGESCIASRASVPLPPPLPLQATNNSKVADNAANNSSKEAMCHSKRQLISVELKPGQTTIVSWKKLLKADQTKNQKSSNSIVTPDAMVGSESGQVAAAVPVQPLVNKHEAEPSNRFNAVIEKIERLYMGKHSSDEELDDVPDDDQYDTDDSFIDDAELDEYFKVDKQSTKHNGYFVNKGKLEGTESSSSLNMAREKRRRKDSADVGVESKSVHIKKASNARMKVGARKVSLSGTKLQNSLKMETVFGEKNTMKDKQNVSSGIQKNNFLDSSTNVEKISHTKTSKDFDSLKSSPTHKSKLQNNSIHILHHASDKKDRTESQSKKLLDNQKEPEKMDGSATKPKGRALERAICDLEKVVALCLPPKDDIKDMNPESQHTVKKRLPQDVKQKLAKVVRLSVNQNKMSEEVLIDRLMGIVGHIIQRRSLKRNMRDMAESVLSGKQEKIDRFEQIKKEISGMVTTHVSFSKSKDGSADDLRDNGNNERKFQGKYVMDNVLEDKICELYDLYAERTDNDKDCRPKEIYRKLAELWPKDYLDGNAIKDAIGRSKDRKSAQLLQRKACDEISIKRKKLTSVSGVKKANVGASTQQQPIKGKITNAAEKNVINQPVPSANDSTSHKTSKHPEKAKVSSSTSKMGEASQKVKKKLKRKPEIDVNEIHLRPSKLPNHGNTIHPPAKRSEGNEVQNNSELKDYGANASIRPQPNAPSLCVL